MRVEDINTGREYLALQYTGDNDKEMVKFLEGKLMAKHTSTVEIKLLPRCNVVHVGVKNWIVKLGPGKYAQYRRREFAATYREAVLA